MRGCKNNVAVIDRIKKRRKYLKMLHNGTMIIIIWASIILVPTIVISLY